MPCRPPRQAYHPAQSCHPCHPCLPRSGGEALAEAYLTAIWGSTAALQEFAGALPKGGDLHIHLTGAPYAEDVVTGES